MICLKNNPEKKKKKEKKANWGIFLEYNTSSIYFTELLFKQLGGTSKSAQVKGVNDKAWCTWLKVLRDSGAANQPRTPNCTFLT